MAKKKQGLKMLVNAVGGETRVAICRDGRLEELWVEHTASPVGNIYKGRVTNVERGLQAAFVDCGTGKEGFLHVTDVHPSRFPKQRSECVGNRVRRRERPLIERCLRRGDEVVVQVVKDGFGNKGPALTMYLSIPGRTLVMLPHSRGAGVSRRVTDYDERRRLREMLSNLALPAGAGFILRTAGNACVKSDLQSDVKYLTGLWNTMNRRMKQGAPVELLRECDIVTQVVRDRWTKDFDQVVVDDPETARKVTEFLRLTVPRMRRQLVSVHTGRPIFEAHGVEAEVERLRDRTVSLPSGGSIVIDPTEALVAIDVNSGKMKGRRGTEDIALRTNLEAATEIARQLRLRDLGGLIVVDFIDLMQFKNRERVTRTLSDALAVHKEKATVLPMSDFGLVEVTRQRSRASVGSSFHDSCPTCRGTGLVKSLASGVAGLLREMRAAASASPGLEIRAWAPSEIVVDILNRRRGDLTVLESIAGAPVSLYISESGDTRVTTFRGEVIAKPTAVTGVVAKSAKSEVDNGFGAGISIKGNGCRKNGYRKRPNKRPKRPRRCGKAVKRSR